MGKVKLSAAFEQAGGGLGDIVVAKYRNGQITRRRPRYRRPTTAAQAAVADRMRQASIAWNALTSDEVQEWRRYAESITRSSLVTGAHYHGNAQTEFVALTTKFLQATPGGIVPTLPPSDSYIGDRVLVNVSAIEDGVRWVASAPNDSDSVTELLIQKLPNPRRKPTKQYVSAAFVQFVGGSLSYDLPLEPGTYSLAYRFVRLSTGQATLLLLCGLVEVADSAAVAA